MAQIEYFYTALSLYAYLGSERLMQIAEKAGAEIVHKPIHLRKVLPATKLVPIRERGAANLDYFFRREKERWAEYRDVPIMQGMPTHHDNDETLSNCMIIAAVQRGDDADALAHGILRAHWVEDADHADPATLAAIADGLGMDGAALLDAAGADAIQAIYDANTAEAIERSMFGSPTYFVDGDMFYGQDRLELVERALEKPFAGTWR